MDVKGSFGVRANRALKANETFRVLLLDDRFIFVKVGGQLKGAGYYAAAFLTTVIAALGTQLYGAAGALLGGAVGGAVGFLLGRVFENMINRRATARLAVLDASSVEEALGANKSNFQILYSEVVSLKVEPALPGVYGQRNGSLSIRIARDLKFDITEGYEDAVRKIGAVFPEVLLNAPEFSEHDPFITQREAQSRIRTLFVWLTPLAVLTWAGIAWLVCWQLNVLPDSTIELVLAFAAAALVLSLGMYVLARRCASKTNTNPQSRTLYRLIDQHPGRFLMRLLPAILLLVVSIYGGTRVVVKAAIERMDLSYTARAIENVNKNDYEAARANVARAIQANPKDWMAYFMQGFLESHDGQIEAAVASMTKAIELNPKDPKSYDQRGLYYRKLKQYELSIADYDKAIDLAPHSATFYDDRGSAYYDSKQYQDAIKDYTTALELDPTFAVFYYGRGSAYQQIGEFDLAIEDLTKAIELNPSGTDAYITRGTIYLDLGEFKSASDDYYKVISLDPSNAEAYYCMGSMYDRRKLWDLAIPEYRRAIGLNQQYAAAYNNLGVDYLMLYKPQYDDAASALTTAVELDREVAIYHYSLGFLYERTQRPDMAREEYSRALELSADPAELEAINGGLNRLNGSKSQFLRTTASQGSVELSRACSTGLIL